MTQQEAKASIGLPFTLNFTRGVRFDTIRSVSDDGTVKGDFIEAPADSCRLKLPQPEALKNHQAHGKN